MSKVVVKFGSVTARVAIVTAISLPLFACGGDSESQSFTLSVTTGNGGTVSSVNQSVRSGEKASFTITADPGYGIASVSGCGGSLTGNTYTTGVITAACSVSVSFNVMLAAPQNLTVTKASGQLSFHWDTVEDAAGYNLYYDVEPDISPANYSTSNTGVLVENVVSPHTLTGLDNGVVYYAVVTARVGAVESAPSTEVSAFPEEPFAAIGGLNDSGIDWCADDSTNKLDCPVEGFSGSDAEHGRDAKARADTLVKIGSGTAGFDYSKIGAAGQILTVQDVAWDDNGNETEGSKWSCVRDNVPGLIWEVKLNDGGLHDRDNTYSWYNPDDSSNGGQAGIQNGGQCIGSACDTAAFVQIVNQQGLCGAKDWRMPTEMELLGIVHNGENNPSIDTGYFPNTVPKQFWSSTPYVRDSAAALGIEFYSGSLNPNGNGSVKSYSNAVRLVRAGENGL